MGRTKSFSKNNYVNNEPIIIYGASVYGEIAYYALRELDILPTYFCDQMQEMKTYFGIPVIHLTDLEKMKNANIIIASADYFCEIKENLDEIGCTNLFDMVNLLNADIPDEKLSNRAKVFYANKQRYTDVVFNVAMDSELTFTRVQFVVSERCSLKCRDCTHLMQYYQYPEDINLEQYKKAFDILLDAVHVIGELRILGGEPFMNKEMYKVIDWYHNSDKIQSIFVCTNGTIIPNEKILQSLQKEKVKVHISNYGFNSEKVSRVVEVFKKYHITYFERKYDDWQDAGNLEFRGYTKEYMKTIFSRCYERNCITFLKGQLHRCPRSAHAMNIGAMNVVKEDFVDLGNWSGDRVELTEQIKLLMERRYIEACNYCDGPNNHLQNIPPAVQVKTPLTYKKLEK